MFDTEDTSALQTWIIASPDINAIMSTWSYIFFWPIPVKLRPNRGAEFLPPVSSTWSFYESHPVSCFFQGFAQWPGKCFSSNINQYLLFSALLRLIVIYILLIPTQKSGCFLNTLHLPQLQRSWQYVIESVNILCRQFHPWRVEHGVLLYFWSHRFSKCIDKAGGAEMWPLLGCVHVWDKERSKNQFELVIIYLHLSVYATGKLRNARWILINNTCYGFPL